MAHNSSPNWNGLRVRPWLHFISRTGIIFEQELRNSLFICGNPDRQMWMLLVAKKQKVSAALHAAG